MEQTHIRPSLVFGKKERVIFEGVSFQDGHRIIEVVPI
jgi:hypothetical protein